MYLPLRAVHRAGLYGGGEQSDYLLSDWIDESDHLTKIPYVGRIIYFFYIKDERCRLSIKGRSSSFSYSAKPT